MVAHILQQIPMLFQVSSEISVSYNHEVKDNTSQHQTMYCHTDYKNSVFQHITSQFNHQFILCLSFILNDFNHDTTANYYVDHYYEVL